MFEWMATSWIHLQEGNILVYEGLNRIYWIMAEIFCVRVWELYWFIREFDFGCLDDINGIQEWYGVQWSHIRRWECYPRRQQLKIWKFCVMVYFNAYPNTPLATILSLSRNVFGLFMITSLCTNAYHCPCFDFFQRFHESSNQ